MSDCSSTSVKVCASSGSAGCCLVGGARERERGAAAGGGRGGSQGGPCGEGGGGGEGKVGRAAFASIPRFAAGPCASWGCASGGLRGSALWGPRARACPVLSPKPPEGPRPHSSHVQHMPSALGTSRRLTRPLTRLQADRRPHGALEEAAPALPGMQRDAQALKPRATRLQRLQSGTRSTAVSTALATCASSAAGPARRTRRCEHVFAACRKLH